MKKFISLFFLCCMLCGASGEISGVVRVHIYPVVPSKNIPVSGDTAFLVDKKEGIFVAMNPEYAHGLSSLVPFIRLEAIDGRVLRCHMVQAMHRIHLLKVYEEDRHLLEGLHEFRVCKSPPPVRADVRFVADWPTKVWANAKISSTWSYSHQCSTVYEVTAMEQMLETGSPVVLLKTGEVVGVIAVRNLATILAYSGESLAFQLDHFKKTGSLFTPHLGVAFIRPSYQSLEKELGADFKPRGYDLSKLNDSRVVSVGSVWIEDGCALSPFEVSDVFLAIDNKPIREERHVWEALCAAQNKGAKSVTVRLWRYGVVREEKIKIRHFSNTMAKRIHDYGPCTFVEGAQLRDAEQTYLMVVCRGMCPLAGSELQKIDGQEVKTIDDVIAALKGNDQDGLWLQFKTLGESGSDYRLPKREQMYFLWPTTTPRVSATYVNNDGWRKQC